MSKSARSVFTYGIYLAINGLLLLLAPNMLITSLGIKPATEDWIRLPGILIMAIAVYYFLAAKYELVVIIIAFSENI